MKANSFINIDLAKVYKATVRNAENYLTTLAFGDAVEVIESTAAWLKIRITDFKGDDQEAFILPSSSSSVRIEEILMPLNENKILKVDFVDVQQGDGAVIETPDGEIVLIDGGDNQLFARYLAARFKNHTADNPLNVHSLLVTHGDADHFKGLIEIYESEKMEDRAKRLFINPGSVYHNGLLKAPGTVNNKKLKDTEMFGRTVTADERLYVSELHEDFTAVDDERMNIYFRKWKDALKAYRLRNPSLSIKRLDSTTTGVFGFSNANLKMQLLAPITEKHEGLNCLPFLKTPPKLIGSKQLKKSGNEITTGSYSASHTINGHSVVFRLKYHNATFLFCGDLNEEAEELLVKQDALGLIDLNSMILKVPHHGSADFSNEFLNAVNPLASIVSSGDESEAKEYIHPRATLMGSLGKYSRTDRPLIFVTELAAFFKSKGKAVLADVDEGKGKEFWAFERINFGIIKVRTDGHRMLIFTHSGQKDLKEAYAFNLDNEGVPQRVDILAV